MESLKQIRCQSRVLFDELGHDLYAFTLFHLVQEGNDLIVLFLLEHGHEHLLGVLRSLTLKGGHGHLKLGTCFLSLDFGPLLIKGLALQGKLALAQIQIVDPLNE